MEENAATNAEALRDRLADHLAQFIIVGSGLALWLFFPLRTFPPIPIAVLCVVMGIGVWVQQHIEESPILARQVLLWGLIITFQVTLFLFNDLYFPFLGLILLFLAAMLVRGSELLVAGLTLTSATWLTLSGQRHYPLVELSLIFGVGLLLAWVAVSTLYTALAWESFSRERANRLLDEVREHRAALSKTLKSLNQAYEHQEGIQRRLIIAEREADERRRMKEQFAANISHELRTSLNLILGFSEVMYGSPEVYGEIAWPLTLRRDITQIYRNSRYLLEMIDDILDLSRVEMTGFALSIEPTNMNALLDDVSAVAGDLFQESVVRFECSMMPDLPSLEIDRRRIRQVILNLLNNARRFTEAGCVQLSAMRKNDEVIIQVSDTGIGISEEQLPLIFNEFYQVDSSLSRQYSGTGLGLAISKKFVEAHAGRIWVKSQKGPSGSGSVFSFSLPIRPRVVATQTHPADISRTQELPSILVVDPDPASSLLLHRHLPNHEIVQVANADLLSEVARATHPQAILLNALYHDQIPQPTAVHLNLPIIRCVLPSHTWIERMLGVQVLLSKPLMAQQLFQAIARIETVVSRVLIINNNVAFAQLIERILQTSPNPIGVKCAYSAEEAFEVIADWIPNLVILDADISMPVGTQAVDPLRQALVSAKIPILLLADPDSIKNISAPINSEIRISRPGGLRTAEILHYAVSFFESLNPNG